MKLFKCFIIFVLVFSYFFVFAQQKPAHLEIGDSLILKVYSKPVWNETDIEVKNGETYLFSASGEWTDWYIISDAKGYDMNHMNSFRKYRRSPENKWFALMASVDKSDNGFLIGKYAVIKITETGRMFLFANDVKGFYFNNKGFLTVKIKRISEKP
jgi:hypothetical protein